PDEGVESLNIAGGCPFLLPPVNLYRPRLAQLDCDNARGRIRPDEELVFLESHDSFTDRADFRSSQNMPMTAPNIRRAVRAIASFAPNEIGCCRIILRSEATRRRPIRRKGSIRPLTMAAQ